MQSVIEEYQETLLLQLFKSFVLRQQIQVKEVTVCTSSPMYRVKKMFLKKITEDTRIKLQKLLFPGEHSDISHMEPVTLQNSVPKKQLDQETGRVISNSSCHHQQVLY